MTHTQNQLGGGTSSGLFARFLASMPILPNRADPLRLLGAAWANHPLESNGKDRKNAHKRKRPLSRTGRSLTGGRMYRMRANKQNGTGNSEAALTNAFVERTGQHEAALFGYYANGHAESSPIVFSSASLRGVL